MKKPFAILCAATIAAAALLPFTANSVFASVPRYAFETEDGKWDGHVYNPEVVGDVEIVLVQPLYAKYTNGKTVKLKDTSKLWVRLCEANTRACTAYYNLASGKAQFDNVQVGHFYVDVKDELPNAHVSGQLDVVFK
ncbi:hypothetical protein CLV36_10649 [Laceyella sediminis]|jgi:hypothetical protein|uniref:Uncharacterized protein n=1 Tax=Laceyella sediminis TaxID=573074 RepID=A0ABX5EQQ7_9BACL|nr:hypothetical protein [Laceyella sediminis]PRZ14289.1 hypothetical protein CLV36_10649 [Laceyella sediminis]